MSVINGLRVPDVPNDPNFANDLQNLAEDVNQKQTDTVSDMPALDLRTGMQTGDQIFVVALGQIATYDSVSGWTVRNSPWVAIDINPSWSLVLPAIGSGGFVLYAGYCRRNDSVYLRGNLGGGDVGSVMATLPPGFRPSAVKSFITHANGGEGEILVYPNGDVKLAQLVSTANTNSVSLDQVAYLLY